MTAAERLTARIAKNREIDERLTRDSAGATLESIVTRLDARKQRATYGAVAGLLGVIPRGLMGGRQKCHKYSWVVAGSGPARGWPTDYSENQIHPECLRQIRSHSDDPITDAGALSQWLKE
jgi:hypothetical protein